MPGENAEKKKNTIEELAEDQKRIMAILGINRLPQAIAIIDAGITERAGGQPTSYTDEIANFPEVETSATPGQMPYTAKPNEQGELVIGTGGGKARAIAGIELLRYFHVPVIVTGRYPVPEINGRKLPEEHWKVYRNYLEKAGVSPEQILEEKDSMTTIQGIINLVKMATEQRWTSLVVIGNDLHLPRIKQFYEYLQTKETAQNKLKYVLANLPENFHRIIGYQVVGFSEEPEIVFDTGNPFFDNLENLAIDFVSAEEILMEKSSHYKNLIALAEETGPYKKRKALEDNGLKELRAGVYGKPKT